MNKSVTTLNPIMTASKRQKLSSYTLVRPKTAQKDLRFQSPNRNIKERLEPIKKDASIQEDGFNTSLERIAIKNGRFKIEHDYVSPRSILQKQEQLLDI
mmetsp:Transcript_34440/g.39834  ORF Transcript_34440/g.39834 Transcript_34440/m.39834 type:complete len:99 (+) Transcript_34440:905-1201(+)